MRARIENKLEIEVGGVDLTEIENIEFYIGQGSTFRKYTPQIIDSKSMLVKIPLEDAKCLSPGAPAELQFAFTDNNGNDDASEITKIPVDNLLNEGGYPSEQ